MPLPGTRRTERLEENIAAAEVVLSVDDLTPIRDTLPDGAFGARYAGDMVPELDLERSGWRPSQPPSQHPAENRARC